MYDPIEKPMHYNLGIETSKYIKSWNMDYFSGNIIKYVTRAPHKGKLLEDLRKARWYLDRLIETAEDAVIESVTTSGSATWFPKECDVCGDAYFCDGTHKEAEDDWVNPEVPLDIEGKPWDARKFEKDEADGLRELVNGHLDKVFPPGWPYDKDTDAPACPKCEDIDLARDWRDTGVEDCDVHDSCECELCDRYEDAKDILAEIRKRQAYEDDGK